MIGLIVATLLFVAASTAQADPSAYHAPKPAHYAAEAYHQQLYEPKPYGYAQGVKDEFTGVDIDVAESSDGKAVHGQDIVALLNGRPQK